MKLFPITSAQLLINFQLFLNSTSFSSSIAFLEGQVKTIWKSQTDMN